MRLKLMRAKNDGHLLGDNFQDCLSLPNTFKQIQNQSYWHMQLITVWRRGWHSTWCEEFLAVAFVSFYAKKNLLISLDYFARCEKNSASQVSGSSTAFFRSLHLTLILTRATKVASCRPMFSQAVLDCWQQTLKNGVWLRWIQFCFSVKIQIRLCLDSDKAKSVCFTFSYLSNGKTFEELWL